MCRGTSRGAACSLETFLVWITVSEVRSPSILPLDVVIIHPLAHRTILELTHQSHKIANHRFENDLSLLPRRQGRVAIHSGLGKSRPVIHHADRSWIGEIIPDEIRIGLAVVLARLVHLHALAVEV